MTILVYKDYCCQTHDNYDNHPNKPLLHAWKGYAQENRPANTLYITPAIFQSVSHAEPGNGGILI